MITAEQVEQALAELGDEPEVIAVNLAHLGIRCEPKNVCLCPIAVFVQRRFEMPADEVHVDGDVVTIFLDEEDDRQPYFDAELTEGARRFISDFDEGDYPELIARAES